MTCLQHGPEACADRKILVEASEGLEKAQVQLLTSVICFTFFLSGLIFCRFSPQTDTTFTAPYLNSLSILLQLLPQHYTCNVIYAPACFKFTSCLVKEKEKKNLQIMDFIISGFERYHLEFLAVEILSISSMSREQLAYVIPYKMQGNLEAPKLNKRRENRDKMNTSREGKCKII